MRLNVCFIPKFGDILYFILNDIDYLIPKYGLTKS